MTKHEMIKKYRLKRKMTQGELAGLCDVTLQYISMVERKETSLSRKIFARLINELEIPIKEVENVIKKDALLKARIDFNWLINEINDQFFQIKEL